MRDRGFGTGRSELRAGRELVLPRRGCVTSWGLPVWEGVWLGGELEWAGSGDGRGAT